ncbi:hypothetical protein [Paenibacillus sp. USDA918EY]|uniref:hypothetical protein n=1 Tax=Paenibacillus sp. USDA918EY TaxID=2689575 RepID=UPI00135C842A|nr:hypothetical protein [Paenibacillus sp. USDA918EY]
MKTRIKGPQQPSVLNSDRATSSYLQIGNHEYLWDKERNSITRYNEKTKMHVTVTFSEEENSVVEDLIKMLTEEYINQCLQRAGSNKQAISAIYREHKDGE